MSQETFEERVMADFDKRYMDGDFGDFNERGDVVPLDAIKSFLQKALKDQREFIAREMIALSDAEEERYPTEFNEWRAFKGLRNKLRDTYLSHKE